VNDQLEEPERLKAGGWLLRWVLQTVLLAVSWFVVFGLFDGFDRDLLWLRALAFGAAVSTVGVVPDMWKARRARQAASR
jgi:hypothetical protein